MSMIEMVKDPVTSNAKPELYLLVPFDFYVGGSSVGRAHTCRYRLFPQMRGADCGYFALGA